MVDLSFDAVARADTTKFGVAGSGAGRERGRDGVLAVGGVFPCPIVASSVTDPSIVFVGRTKIGTFTAESDEGTVRVVGTRNDDRVDDAS